MSAVIAIVLAILKILGIILLFLLVMVLLALLLPSAVSVDWTPQLLTVRVRVLLIWLTILPAKPARTSRPKKAKKETPEQPGKKSFLQERLRLLVEKFRNDPLQKAQHLLSHASKFSLAVMRALRLRHLEVFLPVSGQDAADTAIRYGETMAVAGNLWAQLNERMKVQTDRVWFEPDYTGDLVKKTHFACQISAQLYIIVAAAIVLLVRVVKDPVLRA